MEGGHYNKGVMGTTDITKAIKGRGCLKVTAYVNYGMLTVHVIQAKHLRSTVTARCNTYVTVSLSPDEEQRSWCFTKVIEDSNQPMIDEKFSYELLDDDFKKRLFICVWNTNPFQEGSEFLGCMSFGVRHIMTKRTEVSGWYFLLSEELGKRKHLQAVLNRAHPAPQPLKPRTESMHNVTIMSNTSTTSNSSTTSRMSHMSHMSTASHRSHMSLRSHNMSHACHSSRPSHNTSYACQPTRPSHNTSYACQPSRSSHNRSKIEDLENVWMDTLTIVLRRGSGNIGFTLTGEAPAQVCSVQNDSPAERCGLKEEDYIMSINGYNVAEGSTQVVANVIRQCRTSKLILEIQRPKPLCRFGPPSHTTTGGSTSQAGGTGQTKSKQGQQGLKRKAAHSSTSSLHKTGQKLRQLVNRSSSFLGKFR